MCSGQTQSTKGTISDEPELTDSLAVEPHWMMHDCKLSLDI